MSIISWKKKKNKPLGFVFVFIVVFQYSAERALFRIIPLECSSVFLFLLDSYHLFLQILIFSIIFAVFWHSQVPSAEYYLSYLQIAEFWSEGRRRFWSQVLWNQSLQGFWIPESFSEIKLPLISIIFIFLCIKKCLTQSKSCKLTAVMCYYLTL